MGIIRDLLLGPAANYATTGLLTWHAPQDSIQSLLVADTIGDHPETAILNRDTALQVPAVKRAHDIVCGVLADMPWRQYDNDTETEQPAWLHTTLTGIPPRDLRYAVVSDLFMSGWAVIGFEIGPDGLPLDALHIPAGMWTIKAGQVTVKPENIPDRYLQHIVPIRLGYGSNGILNDGANEIRDARAIAAAYRDRIENPVAQTILSVAADRWDSWTREEREEFRQLWISARSSAGGATAMKPDWVSVEQSGSLPADLFESGRNANRLDLANHAGLPASILEGAKQGSGDLHYSTEAGGAQRNELWDTGLSKYASAIAARLSLDDVCAPGLSIRVDPSHYLTAPQPTAQQPTED